MKYYMNNVNRGVRGYIACFHTDLNVIFYYIIPKQISEHLKKNKQKQSQ